MTDVECAKCGKYIGTKIRLPKKCPFCKEKFEEAAPPPKPLSIEKCSAIIKKFNDEHNTNYSYGNFLYKEMLR